jgi:hypothetical protein
MCQLTKKRPDIQGMTRDGLIGVRETTAKALDTRRNEQSHSRPQCRVVNIVGDMSKFSSMGIASTLSASTPKSPLLLVNIE